MLKTKLSCCERSDRVQSMMKTRQGNNMTDRIGIVNAKIEIELLGPIQTGVVSEENQTKEQHD